MRRREPRRRRAGRRAACSKSRCTKCTSLSFPLARMVDGMATAPLSPPHPDFVAAMGRTNDAIIYGGRAHLFVTGPADEAEALAEAAAERQPRAITASRSPKSSRPQGRFLRDRPEPVQPGQAMVTAVETGETFRAGKIELGIARYLIRLNHRPPERPAEKRLRTDPDRPCTSTGSIGMRGALTPPLPRWAPTPFRFALSACGFDTRRPPGSPFPGSAGGCPIALFVRAIGAGSFEAVTRGSACCMRWATRRPGLESARARSNAASTSPRRVSCSRRRHPDAGDLDGASGRQAAARSAARMRPRAAGPEAALRRARAGAAADPAEADLPRARSGRGRLLPATFRRPVADARFADMRVLVSRGEIVAAMTRRTQPLDHQCQARARKPDAVESPSEHARPCVARRPAIGADYRRRRSAARRATARPACSR